MVRKLTVSDVAIDIKQEIKQTKTLKNCTFWVAILKTSFLMLLLPLLNDYIHPIYNLDLEQHDINEKGEMTR